MMFDSTYFSTFPGIVFFTYLLKDISDVICFFYCVLTGNLDWVGNEFTFNAGAGLVISQPEGIEERNSTVVEQLRAAFERDWFSRYTRSLQANKIPICNKHQINKLVSVKAKHVDNGPVPIRRGQHDNRPAPMRSSHKDSDQTTLRMRHNDDRLSKIRHQGVVNGLGPIDNYQERGQVKMSHLNNEQVQMQDRNCDNLMDLTSQTAESSGSREISNGSL